MGASHISRIMFVPMGGSLAALIVITVWLINLAIFPIDCYYNETKFKKMILSDHSNDDAIYMSTTDLINRSGFRYLEYYAVGDDGYITQLIRLVNPKADPKLLKRPPVLLLHGSHFDSSIYVVSSSIQHHPEPWPRKPSDGPMASSNRSLAFALANRGYDVWLIGSRGSNPANSGWTHNAKHYKELQPTFRPTKLMRAASYSPIYWNFDLDDIIKNELPNQIDMVRNLTGMREFHYFAYSLSTATTMAFLGENPNYAKDVRTYTQMAPVIAASHFTHLRKYYWEKLSPYLPNSGIGFGPLYFWGDIIVKKLILLLSNSDRLRYSAVNEWFRFLFGPTPDYQTNLEKNIIHHIIQPASFKITKQYGQSSKYGKFRYYDYGRLGNLIRYNKTTPPEHKVDRLEVQNYLLISGSLDCLADAVTVQRIKELTSTPKPASHIVAPGFNHLDLIAGVENDIYVNLPYIEYLDKHSDTPNAINSIHNATIKSTANSVIIGNLISNTNTTSLAKPMANLSQK